MLAASALFALMATLVSAVHRLQPELSSSLVSLVRAAVNLILLVLWALPAPARLLGDRRLSLWARGVFGGLTLLCYFAALSRVGLGEAAFLNQTSAAWVALLSPLLLRERVSGWALLAIAGALTGVFLLSYPRAGLPALTALSVSSGAAEASGRALGALSGLLAALAYVSVRRAGASNPPQVIVFYFTLLATAVSAVAVALEPLVWPAGPLVWLVLVGIGVCATFAQVLMTQAYRIGPATAVSAVAYAGPLISAVLGSLLLEQRPDRAGWLGMGLILLCGVALPYLVSRRR